MNRNKRKKTSRIAMERARERKRRLLMILVSVCLVLAGFVAADIHVVRHRTPETVPDGNTPAAQETTVAGDTAASFTSLYVPSVALDHSVMLSAVMSEAEKGGFTSVTFDIKRNDGTIGYASQLLSVNKYGAISSPATQLYESQNELKTKNITCIGRICCLADNVAPAKNKNMALLKGKQVYTDKDGNTYLNPDSNETFNYLRDIVNECKNSGITTVILSQCTLPKEMQKGHKDGFAALSEKLSHAMDGEVTFIEGVDATVNGWDAENGEYTKAALKRDISKLPKLGDNQVYTITTSRNRDDVNAALKKAGVKRYVIMN